MFLLILGILGFILFTAISAIINGLVLCKLWSWFVVPTFELPELHLPVALGLSLIIGYLTNHTITKKDNDEKTDWVYVLAMSMVYPPIVLFIGWLYTLFM